MTTHKKAREIGGVLLAATTLATAIALFTYNPGDVSASVSCNSPEVHNLLGRIGAHAADLLLQAFGMGVVVPLAALVWLSIRLFIRKPIPRPFAHFFGGFLLLLAGSGLFQLMGFALFHEANFLPGGWLGGILTYYLQNWMNPTGAGLILGTTGLVALLVLIPVPLDEAASSVAIAAAEWRQRRSKRITLQSVPATAPSPGATTEVSVPDLTSPGEGSPKPQAPRPAEAPVSSPQAGASPVSSATLRPAASPDPAFRPVQPSTLKEPAPGPSSSPSPSLLAGTISSATPALATMPPKPPAAPPLQMPPAKPGEAARQNGESTGTPSALSPNPVLPSPSARETSPQPGEAPIPASLIMRSTPGVSSSISSTPSGPSSPVPPPVPKPADPIQPETSARPIPATTPVTAPCPPSGASTQGSAEPTPSQPQAPAAGVFPRETRGTTPAPTPVEVKPPMPQDPAPTASSFTAPAPAAPTPMQAPTPQPAPAIAISKLEMKEEHHTGPGEALHQTPQEGRVLPPTGLLDPNTSPARVNEVELLEKAQQIIQKYAEFGIEGSIDAVHPGPVVTLFEFKPAPGVKYSRMIGLVDDLCLGLRAESIRIDRIPGKSTVGIEVPNAHRQIIHIRELLESREFRESPSPLTMALGKKINGDVYITDLTKMPHLLVAGATGSGKSVGLNTMITSILCKASPEEVKFIFIDPKRLELGMYADIPHMLTPIVTDAKKAANTMLWAVHEMEERYKLLFNYSVRDIASFNRTAHSTGEFDPLPYIVIVIDELAELLSVATKEVELCLQRLAQMARAVGIHIIIATQRPSVEVVTGTIKANFPSRISFRLLSKHDSKTILDTVGAEHLLGKGDMLFLPPNSAKLHRVHGALITEDETKRLVDFIKEHGEPNYQDLRLPGDLEEEEGGESFDSGSDPLYEEVARFVVKQRKASTSLLQRRFSIGYGRAARLMDLLEDEGIVGEASGSRPREVLVPSDYYDEVDETAE